MSGAGAITTNAYHIFAPSHITTIGKGRLRAMHCVSRSRRMEDDDIRVYLQTGKVESIFYHALHFLAGLPANIFAYCGGNLPLQIHSIMAFGHSYQDESLMGSTLAAPHEARRSHALGHLHLCFESRGRLIAA